MSNDTTIDEFNKEQINSAIDAIDEMVKDSYDEVVEIDDFYIDSINNFGQVFSKQLEGLKPPSMSFVKTSIGITTRDEENNLITKEIDVFIIYSGKYWYLVNHKFDLDETVELFTTVDHMLDNPDDYQEDIAFGLKNITVTNNAG